MEFVHNKKHCCDFFNNICTCTHDVIIYSRRSVFFTKTHVSVYAFCEKYAAPTVLLSISGHNGQAECLCY